MPEDDLGSVTLLANGRTRVELDNEGTFVILGRPTLGQYRRWKTAFAELHADYLSELTGLKQQATEVAPSLARAEELDDDQVEAEASRAADEMADRIDALQEDFDRRLIIWTVEVLEGLVTPAEDRTKLPAEPQDLPADLVQGHLIQRRLLQHWTNTPSDRGRVSRPAPTATT